MGSPVRAAVGGLRALGPRASVFADFLSCNSKDFIAANEEISESFPLVVRRGGAKGYGLLCGPHPARAGEEVLRVPPAVWVPYCAEAAVRKAEGGAPDVLARLSNACAKIGGGDASTLAPISCLALELLFTLERDGKEPYLGLLWEASKSDDSLPHPLLMGPEYLDFLQASPLRDSMAASRRIYSTLHRSFFGLEGVDGSLSPRRDDDDAAAAATGATPSALSTRDFLWALGVILSRGVSEDGAGGTGLVPFLDFANHGDTHYSSSTSGGGAAAGASCERGFDPATGCHFLRALRDIAPGEELLIDYGSASKRVYRFARTYGFINFSNSRDNSNNNGSSSSSSSSSSSNSNSNSSSNSRCNTEADNNQDDSTAVSPTDALRVRVDFPAAPPNQQQLQQIITVPVRLADVTAALATHEGSSLPATATAAATAATIGGPREEGGAAPERAAAAAGAAAAGTATATVVVSEAKALKERLRRYSSTLEEDLDFLRRRQRWWQREGGGAESPVPVLPPEVGQEKNSAAEVGGGREIDNHHNEQTEGSAMARSVLAPASAAVAAATAEWAEMCVALRAAEKIALGQALDVRTQLAALPREKHE